MIAPFSGLANLNLAEGRSSDTKTMGRAQLSGIEIRSHRRWASRLVATSPSESSELYIC
jgi:hypothetical protein